MFPEKKGRFKSYPPGLQNMILFEGSFVTEVIKLKESH